MPKYVYCCEVCDELFEVVHGMKEAQDSCILCGKEGFVYRVPQMPSIQKPRSTGHLVDEFIEKNKQTLNEMVKDSKDKDYEF